jgi:dATP pyrophosphohydrolase
VHDVDVLTGSISTYVFSVRERRPLFLLLRRAPGLLHAGDWQAVHGMIDPGEKAYEAARREMAEECGLAPERFFRLDAVETFYSEHTDAVHLVPAFAGYVADAPAAVVSEEHTDFAWCGLEDALARLVFPSQRTAVQAIAAATAAWPAVGAGLREMA